MLLTEGLETTGVIQSGVLTRQGLKGGRSPMMVVKCWTEVWRHRNWGMRSLCRLYCSPKASSSWM